MQIPSEYGLDTDALQSLATRLYSEDQPAQARRVLRLLKDVSADPYVLLLDLMCLVELGEADRARDLFGDLERLMADTASSREIPLANALAIKRVFDRVRDAVVRLPPKHDEKAKREAERMLPRLPRGES